MYKIVSDFSGSVILKISAFKISYTIVLDLTGCKKCRIFVEKCLKVSQKLHGGDRRHIKVRKKTQISKSTDASFFTCFDGVHHICVCE